MGRIYLHAIPLSRRLPLRTRILNLLRTHNDDRYIYGLPKQILKKKNIPKFLIFVTSNRAKCTLADCCNVVGPIVTFQRQIRLIAEYTRTLIIQIDSTQKPQSHFNHSINPRLIICS